MRLDLTCAALSFASLCFALSKPQAEPAAERPAAADLSGLQAAYAAAARSVRPARAGYAMQSTASPLVAHFDGRGMSVVNERTEPWTWGLELTSYGFPGSELAVDEPTAMQAAGSRLAYHWGADLEEWYVNRARGLEHGFTLAQRPAGAEPGELLRFDLRVRGELLAQVSDAGRDVRFALPSGEAAISYAGLVVFDATGAELEARFTADNGHLSLAIDEAAATYPLTIDPIVQQEYLKASNANALDFFGSSVAISGDTAVVGAYLEDSNAVGVDGDETNNMAQDAGAAYVFVRNGSSWTQQAYLKASNPNAGDWFGYDVAIDGDTLVVGAIGEASSATGVGGNPLSNSMPFAGAAYVFHRSGTTWSQQAYLKASNTEMDDSFGESVAISGNRVVVGALLEDSGAAGGDNSKSGAGAAYLFTRTGSTWSGPVYLKAAQPDANDNFGGEVAIDGTRVLISAEGEDGGTSGVNGDQSDESRVDSGAAYLFELVAGTWTQVAYLKASSPDAGDSFGWSVDLDGDRLVVGAAGEDSGSPGVDADQSDNSQTTAGAAYVFSKVGGVWSQEAYIKASNPMLGFQFGEAVALDGGLMAISALAEDGSSVGINGDPSEQNAKSSGATYVFERSGGVWDQTAYVKNSSVDFLDHSGGDIALSGSELLVGVFREDGGSTGIGGDPTDNSLKDSGAVFVFDLAANCGVTAYGPTSGGNVADLALPLTPNVGSKATLKLWNFSGNGVALLFISTAPNFAPLLDGTLLIDLNQNVLGPGGYVPVGVTAGKGETSFGLPPALANQTFYCQAAMADPLLPGGFAFTHGLEVTVCP